MPASNMSRLSISGGQTCQVAADLARDIAHREIGIRIKNGLIHPHDSNTIAKEYKAIYFQEYYKHYAHFLQQEQQSRIIYVPTENPSAKKFYVRHAVANFSKLNCFVHVHRRCITLGRFNYPIDEESSLETKEAYLSIWPGPLDRKDVGLKESITDYIKTLKMNDSQRRIRYTNVNGIGVDEQRKIILNLLLQLIHRSRTIDAHAITELLLRPEQTEIGKNDGVLKTLEKHLLLGKRVEAIKFAKTRKLWDHAHCLAFLDTYQPPNTGDSLKKIDSIVQLNVEYITSIEHETLNTVYKALLSKILKSDPESVNIVKKHNVGNDSYEFAILSANDCEMEFDQSNEVFKLINAVKKAIQDDINTSNHLIFLGYATLDNLDNSEDYSLRSQQSYLQKETFASRTLTITNIEMLIVNEIWEYCLNLKPETSNPTNYEYMINLVPYKLMLASKLLDFGLLHRFAYYIDSIKMALAKSSSDIHRDPSYDWATIEICVDYLESIRELFRYSPETLPQNSPLPAVLNNRQNHFDSALYSSSFPTFSQHLHSNQMVQNELQQDITDAAQNDYPSLPYQSENPFPNAHLSHNYPHMKQNYPPQIFNQPSIQEEEVVDYNPEPLQSIEENRNINDSPQHQQQNFNSYSNESSRRTSATQPIDAPLFSPPSFGPPRMNIPNSRVNQNAMTSSSPVHSTRESGQSNLPNSESFDSPYSPINENDDLPRPTASTSNNNLQSGLVSGGSPTPRASSNTSGGASSSNPQPGGDQQPSFFNLLKSKVLPSSNTRQMILPDDSRPTMVWNAERNAWVDTTRPEGDEENNATDAPPVMKLTQTPVYSFNNKRRYPTQSFN